MKPKTMAMILFLSFFSLMGCETLAPEYHRPTAPIPHGWPQGEAYGNTRQAVNTPMASGVSWQNFFADPKLQKVIRIALHSNRDLRLAALNVERARALYGVQHAELFPTIGATGAGGKRRRSSDLIMPREPRNVEQYTVNLGIASWEIDFFGRIRSLKKRALEAYLATEEARRSAQISLVSEVGRVYLTLAADRTKLKLACSTLKTQQRVYRLIQKQYNVGLANKLDLRRAQTQVETAKQDVARYTQLVAEDKNALNLLAGSTVPGKLLPAGLNDVIPPKDISPGLSSEVLLQRPDIMAAEHRLKAAYAYIGAARAAFFPRITLTTAIGSASDELSNLFSSGTGTWSFMPQVSMPIFDMRTWEALRVTKVERKIALARYEKAIQTAFREVADALAVKGTINQQLAAQQALVDALQDTYRLSKDRYLKGIDSYLSVLDAQRSLYFQQRILIVLQLAKLANRVRLYAVLGGETRQSQPHKKASQSQ